MIRTALSRLYEFHPAALGVFGLPTTFQISEVLQRKRFRIHSAHFIRMFDGAMNMLGPDREIPTEIVGF